MEHASKGGFLLSYKKRWILAVLLSFLSVPQLQGEPSVSMERTLLYERTVLQQAVILEPFRAVLVNTDQNWVVATITPSRLGSIGEIINGYNVSHSEGACSITASLTRDQDLHSIEHFYTVLPSQFLVRRVEYKPAIRGGGAVVTEVLKVEKETAHLGTIIPVPAEWAADIPGAFIFLKAHPGLLEEPPQPAKEDLTKLLAGDNAWLKIAAFRAIAAADLNDRRLPAAFDGADPMLVSAYVCLLQRATSVAPVEEGNQPDRQIERLLARRPELLRSIGRGSFVTKTYWNNYPSAASARITLRLVKEMAQADEYLNWISTPDRYEHTPADTTRP